MTEKVLFLYNPAAGKGNLRNKISQIVELMMERDFDVTIVATRKAMDATECVLKKGVAYDRIICAGGDGTLHEVTQGLMSLPEEKRPACGYIPAGTTNDFAHSMQLPKRVMRAAEVAVGDRGKACDIGQMNQAYFSYVAAFGAFTSVSYETPQLTKNLLGKTAYILDGAVKLNTIKGYVITVTTDHETWEDNCMLGIVSNAKTVAGLHFYKRNKVSLDDGLFEAVFVRTPKNPIELNLVVAFLMTGKVNDQVKLVHSSQVIIESRDEVAYTLDGENGGKYKKAVITNHRQAITFYS